MHCYESTWYWLKVRVTVALLLICRAQHSAVTVTSGRFPVTCGCLVGACQPVAALKSMEPVPTNDPSPTDVNGSGVTGPASPVCVQRKSKWIKRVQKAKPICSKHLSWAKSVSANNVVAISASTPTSSNHSTLMTDDEISLLVQRLHEILASDDEDSRGDKSNRKYPPFPLFSYYYSVVVCLRCLLHHILSLIVYTFRVNREFVFISVVQFMMGANSRIRLACRSHSFVCTLHHLIIIIVQTLSEDIELIKCLSDIICKVCE